MRFTSLQNLWIPNSYLIILVTCFSNATLTAQSTEWMRRTDGDANGFAQPWQSRDFEWALAAGQSDLTGTLSINRTGSGLAYSGFESHAQTLLAYDKPLTAYDNALRDATLRQVGLSSLHFVSEGENPSRGSIDDSPPLTTSTTTYQFDFTTGQTSQEQSLISIFDPGMYETSASVTSRGPTTYSIAASLNGGAIALTDWSLALLDPYTPTANSTTTHAWDSATGRLLVNNYSNDLGTNFPDTLAFLQTGETRFDQLTVTVESLASELVGIGIIGPIQPVPEPSGFLLTSMSLGLLVRHRKRY